MATITITPEVQLSNVPPRVKLTVTDSGLPAINTVTVTRLDSYSGRTSVVRTYDGEVLTLLTNGSVRTSIVYDYEMPYGQAVTYSTVEQPAVTATVTVDETRSWLIHPGVPALSRTVEFRAGSFDTEDRAVNSGVFQPIGRRNSVVVTDGQRKSPKGTFTLATDTLGDLAALMALMDNAGVLLLNVPVSDGLGIETAYIAVQDLQVTRPSDVGTDQARDIIMPYIVVDSPLGGSQSERTWTDITTTYASWTALLAGQATWAHVLAPTDE
jgi:hypothetical protein